MYKVILALMAIGALAFSAGLRYARPEQARYSLSQAAGFAAIDAGRSAVGRLPEPASAAGEPAQQLRLPDARTTNDGPALALLVYFGCIVIGGAIGVMLARRNQREL
jgi:hypothetical protein